MRKFLIFSLVLSFLAIPDALAHKVVASGWTDGADIEGEVGLSNGEMAQKGTLVEVFTEKDEKIGETMVGEDGLFRFTPKQAIAHKFVVNLGAGHVAQFVMGVDELPEGLSPASDAVPKPTPTPKDTAQTIDHDEIAKIVAKAVRKEVQPLRKEIASYKEKNDMQSILGGIGYILGLTGIVFYIMARRKEKQTS